MQNPVAKKLDSAIAHNLDSAEWMLQNMLRQCLPISLPFSEAQSHLSTQVNLMKFFFYISGKTFTFLTMILIKTPTTFTSILKYFFFPKKKVWARHLSEK